MSFGFGFALPAYPLRGGGGNNPFNQLGPTLDLAFPGVVTDLTDPNGYTLNTDFIIPQYQIAAQYVVWDTGVGLVEKTFSQIITFTRASTATYFDSAGVLQSAAIDAPRLDYNPSTLAAQGLLIEEARTNSIRNNTMQGAVAGTPGTLPTNWSIFTALTGLTRTVVGTGTENGITYIDIRLNGTPSGAGVWFIQTETSTQISASNGQTWTGSAYYKLQAGSTTGITAFLNATSERDAGGNDLGSISTTFTPTSAALSTQRVSSSITNSNASTAAEIQFLRLNLSGVAIDITLRIGLPQLELGAFATSVIPTTTTALTRSADVAAVNTLSPWFNSAEYTLFHEGMVLTNDDGIVYSGVGDTFDNTAYFSRVAPNQVGAVRSGAAVSAQMLITTTPSSGVPFKMAMKVKANDFAFCVNGGSVITDTSGAVPVSTVRLGIGNAPWTALGGNGKQHWVRRITFYPRGLSSAELQTITV